MECLAFVVLHIAADAVQQVILAGRAILQLGVAVEVLRDLREELWYQRLELSRVTTVFGPLGRQGECDVK